MIGLSGDIYGNARDNVDITCEDAVPEFSTQNVGITRAKCDPLLWHTMLAAANIRWSGSIVELELGDDAAC